MSKSLLYAVNSNTQDLEIGENISFGTAVRRFGCNIDANGGTPSITGAGYYSIDIDIDFSTAIGSTGIVSVTLMQDGTAIPGASVEQSVAALTTYTKSISCVVRDRCCGTSTITAVVGGVAINVSNASIRIVKE